jgi:hypothetical protein
MCRIKIIAVGNHNNSSQFQQWPRPTRSTVTAIAATAQKLPTQRPPRLQTCGRPTSTQPVPFCSSYALDLFCCRCVHCFSPLLSVQYIGSLTVMKYSTTGNLPITWYVCMLLGFRPKKKYYRFLLHYKKRCEEMRRIYFARANIVF